MNRNKAPGPNNILSMWLHILILSSTAVNFLRTTCNNCHNYFVITIHAIIPNIKITVYIEGGKYDNKLVLAKLLDHIILACLTSVVEYLNIIPDQQFEFPSGRNMVIHVARIIYYVNKRSYFHHNTVLLILLMSNGFN